MLFNCILVWSVQRNPKLTIPCCVSGKNASLSIRLKGLGFVYYLRKKNAGFIRSDKDSIIEKGVMESWQKRKKKRGREN